ncbi:hypothetical protein GCM10020369_07030 [Cryptosporangium minutisporangium]|uniref:Integral membrane protein n=2 Tax=Cryptosporangium minutisporangium TaxID=113569 RepID=A0ABP6SRL7_9ACTN
MYLLSADVTTMSAGRLTASAAGLIALIGVVLGVLALIRSGDQRWRRAATVAPVLGLIGIVAGGVVVATADGGLGTGNGLGGGVVALVVGAIAVALGGLAQVRSRRASREPSDRIRTRG